MFEDFVSAFPAAFDPESIQRAVAGSLEFEAEDREGSLHSFGEKLNRSVGAPEKSDDRTRAQLMVLDALVCQLWLGNAETVARYEGRALVPMMEFHDRGVFPPPVPAFPASVLPYLARRAAESSRADCRARYHDFISLHPATEKRKAVEHARAAHDLYVTVGSGADLQDTTAAATAFDYLERAAQISATFNIEPEATARAILAEAEREMAGASVGLAWHVVREQAGFLTSAPAEAKHCLQFGIERATEMATRDRNTERGLWEIVEALGSALKDGGAVCRAKRAIAGSWEAEATAAGEGKEFSRMAALQQAIDAYGRAGDGAAVQRLKLSYGEAVKAAGQALSPHQLEVNLDTAKIVAWGEATKTHISSHPHGLIGLPFLLRVWPKWDDVEAEFAKAKTAHPFQWLVSRYHVEPDGRVIPPPEDEKERDEAYLLDHFTFMRQIEAGFYAMLGLPQLTTAGVWSADAVIEAVREVDERLAAASESGLRAYFAGDYWTATHVLVPQLERSLRETAARVSAAVLRLIKDQGLELATMQPVLEDPRMVEFMSPGVAPSMAAIFVEPRGLNIRNQVAHGLYEPGESLAIQAYFTVMGILTAAVASGTAWGRMKEP